jgi:hypothetical protein
MGEWRGDGMTAFKTVMNNYQSFLQTNTKTGKLFKKGFEFSKMSFFFPFDALASQKTILLKVGNNCFCCDPFLLKNATS